MNVFLVGADHEENLGLGYLAAALRAAGHAVQVRPLNHRAQVADLARRLAQTAPDVVGLSLQFQHRVVDFLLLAERLRREGFAGHLTAGGQVASLAWEALLQDAPALDSIVMFEGEQTLVELVQALQDDRALDEVRGLARRAADGTPRRTPARELCMDLDALAPPLRYRAHSRHLGVPFVPVLWSRGCWGGCRFCAIRSFYSGARGRGRGNVFRERSVEHLADEMAAIARTEGPALFCFHDDTLLLPRPQRSLARLRALRTALDARGVGRVGLIGKCRPDCLTPELARELRDLGVIRLYVGVENASAPGQAHLGRQTTRAQLQTALDACAAAGIFACYNLLLFEPDTTLDDVRVNLQFLRDHAHHPVNFCRAEPYVGTLLHADLVARGAFAGDYRSWNYRLRDDRAELLFRICAAAFRQRNFADDGVANRSMSLGYSARILELFAPGPEAASLGREATELTERVVRDTAAHLDEAIAFAATVELADRERIERYTATLGLRVALADARLGEAMDALGARFEACATTHGLATRRSADAPELRPRRGHERLRQLAASAALGLGVAASAASVGTTVDPAPMDAGNLDASDASGLEQWVVDPPPPDGGSQDYTLVDPAPADAGNADQPQVVDPAPADAGEVLGQAPDLPRPAQDRLATVVGRYAERSRDLPMHAPPRLAIGLTGSGSRRQVQLQGVPSVATIRYEVSCGSVEGEGAQVTWHGAEPGAQLRVAVRAPGGVAVAHARA